MTTVGQRTSLGGELSLDCAALGVHDALATTRAAAAAIHAHRGALSDHEPLIALLRNVGFSGVIEARRTDDRGGGSLTRP